MPACDRTYGYGNQEHVQHILRVWHRQMKFTNKVKSIIIAHAGQVNEYRKNEHQQDEHGKNHLLARKFGMACTGGLSCRNMAQHFLLVPSSYPDQYKDSDRYCDGEP